MEDKEKVKDKGKFHKGKVYPVGASGKPDTEGPAGRQATDQRERATCMSRTLASRAVSECVRLTRSAGRSRLSLRRRGLHVDCAADKTLIEDLDRHAFSWQRPGTANEPSLVRVYRLKEGSFQRVSMHLNLMLNPGLCHSTQRHMMTPSPPPTAQIRSARSPCIKHGLNVSSNMMALIASAECAAAILVYYPPATTAHSVREPTWHSHAHSCRWSPRMQHGDAVLRRAFVPACCPSAGLQLAGHAVRVDDVLLGGARVELGVPARRVVERDHLRPGHVLA